MEANLVLFPYEAISWAAVANKLVNFLSLGRGVRFQRKRSRQGAIAETYGSRYDFGGAPTQCAHIVAYVVSHSILLISKAINADPVVLGEKLSQIKYISGVDMLSPRLHLRLDFECNLCFLCERDRLRRLFCFDFPFFFVKL